MGLGLCCSTNYVNRTLALDAEAQFSVIYWMAWFRGYKCLRMCICEIGLEDAIQETMRKSFAERIDLSQ